MRRDRPVRRRTSLVTAGVAGALVLALGGTAWAYWTRPGGGWGTATVTAAAPQLLLHAQPAGPLLPGGSVPVTLTADNPSATSLWLATAFLLGISADAAHPNCNTADFSLPAVAIGQRVPAHTRQFPLDSVGRLSYVSTSVDQSACQGATLTLSLGSS